MSIVVLGSQPASCPEIRVVGIKNSGVRGEGTIGASAVLLVIAKGRPSRIGLATGERPGMELVRDAILNVSKIGIIFNATNRANVAAWQVIQATGAEIDVKV